MAKRIIASKPFADVATDDCSICRFSPAPFILKGKRFCVRHNGPWLAADPRRES